MENKNVFITGATSGLGEAAVQIYKENGYDVYVTARSAKYEEAKEKLGALGIHVYRCDDLGNQEMVSQLFKELAGEGVVFSKAILAAGAFAWDNDTREGKPKKTVEQVAAELRHANFETKKSVIHAMRTTYSQSDLRSMELLQIASSAADFGPNDPKRLNISTGFKQEGYITSMKLVDAFGHDLDAQGIFKRALVDKPPLTDTPLAHEAFCVETIGEEINWRNIPSAYNYMAVTLKKHDFI